ncbi:YncE family protein [Paenibacillus rigui]|uniref:Uncharacterized protein n=1 Tax=Paenibacillus rigui TaxID=554312 RepID=A0A229ULD8_9BACL|nr:hypothetical protein [Paenibacillus rigui]OXM84105.1 hypothetical protein CF651_21940 [Paenibacillus rigui]
MGKWNYRSVNPYIWLISGIMLLSGLFFIIYTTVLPTSQRPPRQVDAANAVEVSAKVLHAAESYRVLEQFQARNPMLPQHSFGALQLARSKAAKGIQALVKKAHILDTYVTPDGAQAVYFVQRNEMQSPHAWTQIDVLTMAPETQQIDQEPIGYIYGEDTEAVAQSTLLCGFISKDEFLYTTVANADQEWVYVVNKFNMTQKTVTPVLELFRYEPLTAVTGGSQPKAPVLYKAVLTPDKKHLLIRDSMNGITSYTLETGTKKGIIPGSNERRSGEQFEVVGESGIALYNANRFQSDIWWIDTQTGSAKQPFSSEQGLIEVGMDANGKVMYYNFTYDRNPANLLIGPDQSLLLSYGVQVLDTGGHPLKRFSLPKDSKERLEFGGYSETKKAVLLHKYTLATNKEGRTYKKTSGWLFGDMNTGAMTALNRLDVPDSWDKSDVVVGKATLEPYSQAAEEQVFANYLDNSYYMCRWKTKQMIQRQDEDVIIYADEPSKRVFVSSFTRPDLVVAAFNYKKYNWDNKAFSWLNGHWMSRHQIQPEGDKVYLFQIN